MSHDPGARRLASPGSIVVIALVALLPLLVLAPAIRRGEVLVPGAILFADVEPWRGVFPDGVEPCLYPRSDVVAQHYPWRTLVADALSRGRLPLWNPWSSCGAPLLANGQSAPLDPTRLVELALPPAPASWAVAFVQLALAALGAYGLGRALDLPRGAALFSAAAFAFCGYVVVWFGYPLTSVAVYLPLLFLLVERFVRAPSARRAALLGLAIGVQFLGGHPETSFHVLLATGAWAVYRLVDAWRRERRVVSRAAGLSGAAVLGLALAAAALVPLLEYMGESSALFARTAKSDAGRDASHPLAPVSALGLVCPTFLGTESSGPRAIGLRPSNNFNELAGGYVGLAALVVGLAGFAAPRRGGPPLFFAAMAVACLPLVYALGPPTEWLSDLPLLSIAANRRFLLVIALATSMLGGFGMAKLLGPDERAARRVAAATVVLAALAGAVLVGIYLWERRHPEIAPGYETGLVASAAGLVLLAALAVARLAGRAPTPPIGAAVALAALLVDAFAFATPVLRGVRPADLFPDVPPIAMLRERTADGSRVAPQAAVLRPETSVVPRLRSIKGYDSMEVRRYTELLAGLSSNRRAEAFVKNVPSLDRLESRVLDLLAVKFVLEPAPLDPVPRGFRFDGETNGVFVYENLEAMPRAFVVTRREVVPDAEARRRALAAFDPRTTVLLEEGDPASGAGAGWPARIVVDEPERVVVEADGGAAGATLVLADAFFPGWKASVDGVEAPIRRADHALRAVELPPGAHRVEFRYEPASVRLGLALSAAAALAVLALLPFGARR